MTRNEILTAYDEGQRRFSGKFDGINLSEMKLDGVDFHAANLCGSNFEATTLNNAIFRAADLRESILRNTDLRNTDLRSANLTKADLTKADLRFVNLSWANLFHANLHGINMCGAIGNCAELRSMQLSEWHVCYTATHLAIGCEQHPINAWWQFTDDRIKEMHVDALEWWRTWKPLLQQIIATAPATPTGQFMEVV